MARAQELESAEPLALEAGGLWAAVLLRGRCLAEAAASGGEAEPAAGGAGDLLLGEGPLQLRPLEPIRIACLQLTGTVPRAFSAGLEAPRFAAAVACPGAAELLDRLVQSTALPAVESSRLAYELLCRLGTVDEAASTLPPLVVDALSAIHSSYMSLYGVEELSEQLGVSKSHLVRAFSAAMGITPGRYLVHTRVEAVKALLLEGEHDLETVAALCGFSGANYLCRVFRRETGLSPAAWRAANLAREVAPGAYRARQRDEIYV